MDNGANNYRRFLAGEDDGIVEIIREYKDGLLLFLDRYVDNVHIAEELTEETFFKLVTKKPRFAAKSSFKTWLYAIGRGVALDFLRKRKRLSDTPIENYADLGSDADSVERAYLREEQKVQLHRALGRISADYATALHLKFFEDMSNEQIASVLKKSKRAIENLLYQAKRALKTELEKEGFEYEEL